MFFEILEDKIERNENKIKESLNKFERLTSALNCLYSECNISPEELKAFLDNPDNFEPGVWDYLQQESQKMEAKTNLELDHIQNPLKTKKAYSDRNVQSHWLFVR